MPANSISETELIECDREQLHYLGAIQGDSGHVVFWSQESGEILAHDEQIHDIPWVIGKGDDKKRKDHQHDPVEAMNIEKKVTPSGEICHPVRATSA